MEKKALKWLLSFSNFVVFFVAPVIGCLNTVVAILAGNLNSVVFNIAAIAILVFLGAKEGAYKR